MAQIFQPMLLGPCGHFDMKRFLVVENYESQNMIIANEQKILNPDNTIVKEFHRNSMPVRDPNRFVIHHIRLLGCISNELLSQKHAKISETHC
jgi:hypothetical protein